MRIRLREQRGASAVEFALIVPLLIVLVLGIAEFGHAFQVQGTLSAAAREGVRGMAPQKDPAAPRAAVRDPPPPVLAPLPGTLSRPPQRSVIPPKRRATIPSVCLPPPLSTPTRQHST